MPVKQRIRYTYGTFFITFTCHQWLPLIDKVNGYELIYHWFDYLKSKGHYINGYIIMPNHVEAKRKANKKLHEVWELSFDWKECRSWEFISQKLSYIHDNPCSKKWNQCNSPVEYPHSSAKFYIAGEQGVYPVTNFMEMEDVAFTKRNNFSLLTQPPRLTYKSGERRCRKRKNPKLKGWGDKWLGRKKLLWDAKNMKITNFDEANQFVKREYRDGWKLGV